MGLMMLAKKGGERRGAKKLDLQERSESHKTVRRGIHFEGSMLLESCCTGASLAAGGWASPASLGRGISIRYASKADSAGPDSSASHEYTWLSIKPWIRILFITGSGSGRNGIA
jgi:hypothetical protein